MTQVVCGKVECAQEWARKKREKAERVADKAKRESLKTRAQWLKEAQTAFNAWIRARDAGQPCISCQRTDLKKINAGHYLSRGARPELRFEPLNVHLQCEPCNSYLSGNAVLYRMNLIGRIGLDRVEWLEGHHDPKKYTIDDLRAIKDEYRAKTRELKR